MNSHALPKMLPALARRAGLSDARVASLWHAAVLRARLSGHRAGSPLFWACAVRSLLNAIDAERSALAAADAQRSAFEQASRLPLEMGLTLFAAGQGVTRAWWDAWKSSGLRAA